MRICGMPKPVLPATHIRLAAITACATAFAYGAFLLNALRRGMWIVDGSGHPIVTDFLPVYAAGLMARSGGAAIAYDWQRLHDFQVTLVGHPFAGYLGWLYPPLYFAVASALTVLGYLPAFLSWVGVTSACFGLVVARIARHPMAAWMALALPPTLACALVGQNGFFSAILFGFMLLCLRNSRPVLAGVVLAALAFKPQLGLLIPFALAAGGYFRTLFVAALLSLAWICTCLWIAPASLVGFLHYLPQTSHAILTEGTTGWVKLQSVYALMRVLGGGDGLGWTAQILAVLLAGGFCAWFWRQRAISFDLKAAALTAGALLSTPYLYFYDLPLLVLPVAFLFRDGAFDRRESAGVATIVLLLIGNVALNGPFGLAAVMLVAALIVRRTFARLGDSEDVANSQSTLLQNPV